MAKVKFQTSDSKDAIRLFGGNLEAFKSRNKIVILVGAAGTGKTFALCLKMHMYAIMYPGVQILLCRKTLPALRNTIVKTYLSIVELTSYKDKVRVLGETRPTEFIYNENEQEWNGVKYSGVSRITLSQIDIQGKALGADYDMIYINQPDTEGLSEDEFTLVASRCRSDNGPYRQILADPNPANDQHWLLLGSMGEKPKWGLIESYHQDNPAYYNHDINEWTDLGKEHIAQLELLPEHLRKSQLEGQWYSMEGMAFANSWDSSKHLISFGSKKAVDLGISKVNEDGEFENAIPQGWHHYLAIDWGGADPFAILLIARHPDQDLFIVHKHIYLIESDIVRIAQLTKKMCEGYDIKNIIADRGRIETTFLENTLGIGITNAKKGAGSVEDSINICNTELLSDRWLFVNANESLAHIPDYKIVEKKGLMGPEEIPNLKLDSKTRGISKHQQDHYYDAWKYFCRYWAELENAYKQPALIWL